LSAAALLASSLRPSLMGRGQSSPPPRYVDVTHPPTPVSRVRGADPHLPNRNHEPSSPPLCRVGMGVCATHRLRRWRTGGVPRDAGPRDTPRQLKTWRWTAGLLPAVASVRRRPLRVTPRRGVPDRVGIPAPGTPTTPPGMVIASQPRQSRDDSVSTWSPQLAHARSVCTLPSSSQSVYTCSLST
jgi:hypothetical protein